MVVTVHTHASCMRNLGIDGVNCNKFCTQNAKEQAFWRMSSTTLMDE